MQTDHFREFEAALPDLLACEPEVLRFDVEEATEPDLRSPIRIDG